MNITKALDMNLKRTVVNAKNVLQRMHTVPINVSKIYTDVSGIVISKALAPAALQTAMPVFMLGEFDRQGGYLNGLKSVPPYPGVYYVQTFVNGMGANSAIITGVSALSEIQGRLKVGDVVTVYADSILAPTTYVWIILSSVPSSMSSILANTKTSQEDLRIGKLRVYEVNYVTTDSNQFSQDLHFTYSDNIGNYRDNTVQPLGIYRSIMDKQTDVITLKLLFDMVQYIGINTYMVYTCDSFRIELKIVNQ